MATARVGHHSNSPFAPHSVSSKSTHPLRGSNRHPPEAVSYTTTGHFGQATGAISECYHSGAYIQTEALPRILLVLGWNRSFPHSTFGGSGQRTPCQTTPTPAQRSSSAPLARSALESFSLAVLLEGQVIAYLAGLLRVHLGRGHCGGDALHLRVASYADRRLTPLWSGPPNSVRTDSVRTVPGRVSYPPALAAPAQLPYSLSGPLPLGCDRALAGRCGGAQ